ncbi:MAG: GFA family protein [Sedimentitalea sp.]|nr:GFA family protein [Sedimentitalea sp.]
MRTGSCNCGGVRFEIAGEMPAASVCHCGQCRRQSGHVWASTHVPDDQLTLTAQEGLRWYRSSDRAQRGFCGTCGSFLFWKAEGEAATSIAMGALDAPTGLHLARHIFVADKGDYYDITDDLPRRAQ